MTIELPNHIPPEFDDWNIDELRQLEHKDCIVK